MHNTFINYINTKLDKHLDAQEQDVIRTFFKLKKLKKHQFLLQEGEVCKIAGFILKGAIRQYTVDDSGKEHIIGLFVEDWWVGDRESFRNGTVTPFYIDAVEQCELLVINREDISIISEYQFMKELVAKLTENQATHLLKRLHTANTRSAEQRLAEFEQQYPNFIFRFPQHFIASYLGMTKETLSRIRSNNSKKRS